MKKNIARSVIFLFVVVLTLNSCKKSVFTVDGTVTNVTGVAVANATVNLNVSGTSNIVYTTVADEMGQFTVTGVEEGSYDLVVTATGYDETLISVSVTQDIVQEIIIVGSAYVYGTIIDSQTGYGLSGVTIGFTTDNTVTNPADAGLIVTTNYSGEYVISGAPVGTFRVIVEASGYFTRILDGVVLISGTNYMDDITSVVPPSEGSLRIVLSWGYEPSDLDSHITGPDGFGDRFHVYYSNDYTNNYEVELDVDDIMSYGPETITINSFIDGMYRYSVHNYSDQSSAGCDGIYNSPARVEIYGSTGLINYFTAPSSVGASGNTWRVFELNVTGSSYQVVPINEYVYASYSSDTGTFKNTKPEPKKTR